MDSQSTDDQTLEAGACRVLVVERSASMRQVLAAYLESLGHQVILAENYAAGLAGLDARFESEQTQLDAIVFGWPTVADADAEACLQSLASERHDDLPAVVLSTDMRAETRAWVSARDNAELLAWKDYKGCQAALNTLLRRPSEPATARAADRRNLILLLVDDNEASRSATSALWTEHGHTVMCAAHSARAIEIARSEAVDIVFIDFQLNAQRGDALCRQMSDDPLCRQAAVVMVLDHPVGHQIVRCLQAGAVDCFYHSESNRLQLARIEALARVLGRQRADAPLRPAAATPEPAASRPAGAGSDSGASAAASAGEAPGSEPPGSRPSGTDVSSADADDSQVLADLARRAGWLPGAVPLLEVLERRCTGTEPGSDDGLLMLLEAREDIVLPAVNELQGRQVTVARVTLRRLLILVDAPTRKAGYLQVQRIMQWVNALGDGTEGGRATSVASVLASPKEPVSNLAPLLGPLIRGLDVISDRYTDQALLIDLKRMLPAYPAG